MAASHQIITDCKSLASTAPTTATQANAIAVVGPIMDYVGIAQAILLKAEQTSVLLAKIITDTAAGDATNLGLLQGIQAALLNTSSPSTQVLTDINTVYNNNIAGINAATLVLVTAAAGPIMDYVGNLKLIRRQFEEMKVNLGGVTGQSGLKQVTDAADPNLTTINNLILVLV